MALVLQLSCGGTRCGCESAWAVSTVARSSIGGDECRICLRICSRAEFNRTTLL